MLRCTSEMFQMKSFKLKDRVISPQSQCYLIGEIGINHNGDLDTAFSLIDKAKLYGFDAVKFQKRTIDIVYTAEELAKPRESPFGTTNGDLKYGLEFSYDDYARISGYCSQKGIDWFCSPWDEESVDFLEQFDPICYKVASASLTDSSLLKHIASKGRPIIASTGMSTLDEVDQAFEILKSNPLLLMHTTSAYPSKDEELNLSVISTLQERYRVPVGYSGHEVGIMPSVFAVVGHGACAVERHITLDRSMWGSDQAASLEPRGMELMSRYIRSWPVVNGQPQKTLLNSELPVKQKLRRVSY